MMSSFNNCYKFYTFSSGRADKLLLFMITAAFPKKMESISETYFYYNFLQRQRNSALGKYNIFLTLIFCLF